MLALELPQLRDPNSPEYKNWHAKMLKTKPSSMPKDSAEYQAWYKKMQEGRGRHKKAWVYNDKEKRSITIDIVALAEYEQQGWHHGRRHYE